MASLLKRGIILSFSRFANQAILILSPVLLVRILSVGEYGSYREFMLYAAIFVPLSSFATQFSLQYLIPKQPQDTRVWTTQTVLFVAGFSSVVILGIWLAAGLIRAYTSFDFVLLLQLYIFFTVNLDFLESYWLGRKRTDYILLYSTGRLLARVTVLVSAAMLFRNAEIVVKSLIIVEAIRFSLVAFFGIRGNLFSTQITREKLRLQASYFVPLGFGAIVVTMNAKLGALLISTKFGSEALAIFVIGSFALPIMNIFRGAIGDVIFPDIVELKTETRSDQLVLWRKATILYCAAVFPTACLLAYYSDVLVETIFTPQYAAAAPVFMVFAAMLCVSCFEFHLPLRAQNANRYFVTGNILALTSNAVILYPLATWLGIVGPAVAFVVSQLVLALYMAYRVLRIYEVSIPELLDWSKISLIVFGVIVCAPILFLFESMIHNDVTRLIVGCALYGTIYLLVIRALGVSEIFRLLQRLVPLQAVQSWRARK